MRALASILLVILLAPGAAALAADEALLGFATGRVSGAEALVAQLEQRSAAAQTLPRPPDIIYRDAAPVCDVDGDGMRDLFVNNLTLRRPPSHAGAQSELQAISGRDGALLWKQDNLFTVGMPAPAGVPVDARGQSFPGAEGSSEPFRDLDGDGLCDLIAVGGDGLGSYGVPVLGEPSVSQSTASLRALSGLDGSELWRVDFDATTTSASDPLLGTYSNVVNEGYLTGVLPFESPAGPRIATKVTDLRYHIQESPIAVGLPTVNPEKPLLRGPAQSEDVRITERIQVRDATTGDLLWERVLGSESPSAEIDARYTNITWISGVAHLTEDDEPDLVLDQLVVSTPRTSEMNHPVTGETLFRYGRGVRVTALDGATGSTLWAAAVLDPLAPAEANVQTEENRETLAWTASTRLGDVDGDGLDEIMASYVTREESLSATIAGAFRTHFVPVSGADGSPLWDVRQQGWGVARALDTEGAVRHIGLGMLDVPAAATEGTQFPPKFIRLLALDAATGETLWSDERSFAQNSFLSYNLGLAQFETMLAPYDWDADGVLDLVSAAQPSARNGRDQVLMATASHRYVIRSGVDGSSLQEIVAWGADGRIVPCGAADGSLTVVSGHARRLEAARFDGATGERLWRTVLHNDPAPRAAVTSMDMTALGAACAPLGDDGADALLGIDIQAYSFERRHEVIPILASVEADGTNTWVTPSVQGNPPSDALFQASIAEDEPSTAQLVGGGLAAFAVGALGAAVTLALLARRGSSLLVMGIVLVLLAPGAMSLGLPAPVALEGPAALPRALGETAAPQGAAPRAADAAAPSRFGDKDTISYAHEVGDLDGDGYEDVVLDQFCTSDDACSTAIDLLDPTAITSAWTCDYPHDLVGVSGANGTPLWTIDLTIQTPINSCGSNTLVGIVPTSQGPALIVHRFEVVWSGVNSEGVSLNDISAILARDGSTLWTYSAKGAYTTDEGTTQTARDYLVAPVVRDGAVHLQGIGWIMSSANSFFSLVPGYPLTDAPVVTHDVHHPVEWAAQLDVETGAELWRADTFQPQPGKNEFPRIYHENSFEYLWGGAYWITDQRAWARDGKVCCGDLNGDGVPELLYDVLEWTQTPNGRVSGPEALNVRLVAIDGATGERILDVTVAEGLPMIRGERLFRYDYTLLAFGNGMASPISVERLGDVDGDGTIDLLVHVTIRQPEFLQRMLLLSGATGEAIWSEESRRDLRALVQGDADGDGVDDFLLLDWYGHEGASPKTDDYVTPRANPISMRSGRTGAEIWRATTYAAPADVLESYKAIQRNGRLDLDADGVGEFFVDDPIYLDDQTAVHQITVISGRDGSPLRTVRTVGAFGIPAAAGDPTEDGQGDFSVLSGDVNDLWVTLYDGASGQALWSRRILALPASGYAEALPNLRFQQLTTPGADALLVTLQIDVTRSYTYIGGCIGCEDEGFGTETVGEYLATMPQMMRVGGEAGTLDWALPEIADVDRLALTLDATPGAIAFDEIYARSSAVGTAALVTRESTPYALPVLGGLLLGFGLVFAGGVVLMRFRGRFEGVPELE